MTNVEKSLVEQILDAMIISIESKPEFNDAVVSKLKELVENGSIGKQAAVSDAIVEK